MDSGARYFLLELAQSVRGLEHLPVALYMLFCAAIMGGITLWAWRHAGVESFRREVIIPEGSPAYLQAAMLLAFAMMLLFSPHYPWYVAWLVPFFVLVPNLPLLAYLMSFFYLFSTALADPGPKMFLLNKILYGTVAVSVLLYLVLRRWPLLTEVFDCGAANERCQTESSRP